MSPKNSNTRAPVLGEHDVTVVAVRDRHVALKRAQWQWTYLLLHHKQTSSSYRGFHKNTISIATTDRSRTALAASMCVCVQHYSLPSPRELFIECLTIQQLIEGLRGRHPVGWVSHN